MTENGEIGSYILDIYNVLQIRFVAGYGHCYILY